jgi:hypothetical protein
MPKTPSEDEIAHLAHQVGIDLPAEFMPDLIEAYGHVRQMVERLSTPRPHGDEPAHVFVPRSFQPRKD